MNMVTDNPAANTDLTVDLKVVELVSNTELAVTDEPLSKTGMNTDEPVANTDSTVVEPVSNTDLKNDESVSNTEMTTEQPSETLNLVPCSQDHVSGEPMSKLDMTTDDHVSNTNLKIVEPVSNTELVNTDEHVSTTTSIKPVAVSNTVLTTDEPVTNTNPTTDPPVANTNSTTNELVAISNTDMTIEEPLSGTNSVTKKLVAVSNTDMTIDEPLLGTNSATEELVAVSNTDMTIDEPLLGTNSATEELVAVSNTDMTIDEPQSGTNLTTNEPGAVSNRNTDVTTDKSMSNTDMTNGEPVSNTDLTAHFTTDQEFDTRAELVDWCQEVGRKVMTVVVIIKSERATVGRKGRLILGCERGGVFRDHRKKSLWEGKEARRVETKRCGCPFVLKGVPLTGDKWKLEVQCATHNHPLTRTSVGHSYAGRLNHEERQIFIDMSKRGVKPREILETIKQRNKENMSTMRTIYNARALLKESVMEDRSVMQQVMKLLLENHYVEWHRRDSETDEVKDIFWAHPESIHLVKCFPSVLMVDCTDKTNWFRMPLFEIVGVTSTGKMFSVAFVFMEAETEDSYVWALSRLKTIFDPKSLPEVFVTDRNVTLMNAVAAVFPEADHLLCTCHISRSIMTHCKEQFETNEEFDKFLENWKHVTKSESQIEFVDKWAAFEMTWAKFPNCLAYLRDTWLSQYKEHFVDAWTNLVRHHGNTTMNRADSAHSKLKKYLESSQSNFMSIWMTMQNMVTREIADVKASFEKSLTIVQRSHRLGPLKELRGFVSHFALDLIVAEISRGQSIDISTTICRCVLRHTHGLPCAHEIEQFSREGRPIPLSSIDSHWKKLSAIPTPEIHCDLDYEPEMQQLIRRWEESSEEERRHLLKKIKELANLASVLLNESVGANVIREGRPRKLTRKDETTASSTSVI